MLGSAATLQQADNLGLVDKERAEFLAGILTSAKKMHRLVTDLLDLDRLDQGIVEPERLPTDMGALARKVVDELEALRDRPFEIDAPSVIVSVDGPKVERIIENLLANAVRHTRPGTPIRAKVSAKDGGALIVVEDEGHGVPDDIKEEIFASFRQGAGASRSGGVGIGLSLVARFAELHSGRAWVEDRDGGGASFKVFLPDEAGAPSPDGGGDGVAKGATARIADEHGGRSSTG